MINRYRTRVSVGALVAAAGFLSSPASFAADIGGVDSYKDVPAVRKSSDWGGAYIGGHTGSTFGEDNNNKVISGGNGSAGGAPNGTGGTAPAGTGNVTISGGNGGQGNGGAGGDGGSVAIGNGNAIVSGNTNTGENAGNGVIQAGDGGDGGAGAGGGNGGNGGNITIGDDNTISSNNTNAGDDSGNLNIIGGPGGAGGVLGLATGNPFDSDDNRLLAGTHFGYNWQSGSTVYGFEADAAFKDNIDDYLASLRGRIGIASHRVLLYATAGVAFAGGGNNADGALVGAAGGNGGDGGNISIGNNNTIGSNNNNAGDNTGNVNINGAGGGGGGGDGVGGKVTFGEDNDSDVGFVGGAGIEMKLSSSVSAGLEGLYYAFGDGDDGRGDFFAIRSRLTFHLQRDQDLYDEPPAVWRGFYIGGHAGIATRIDDEVVDGVTLADGGDGGDGGAGAGGGGGAGGAALLSFEDDSSFIGGAHLGYNWQNNKIVYGLEGDVSLGDDNFRDYLASIRARLGYTMGSHMFYATAGIAFSGGNRRASVDTEAGQDGAEGGDIEIGNNNTIVSNLNNTGDDAGNDTETAGGGAGGAGGAADANFKSDDEVGFVLGAGIESKITDRVSFGVEALYYFFDGNDSKLSVANNGDVSFLGADDGDAFVVRGRVSIHTNTIDAPLK